jgi:hypothetical protein
MNILQINVRKICRIKIKNQKAYPLVKRYEKGKSGIYSYKEYIPKLAANYGINF